MEWKGSKSVAYYLLPAQPQQAPRHSRSPFPLAAGVLVQKAHKPMHCKLVVPGVLTPEMVGLAP